MEKICKSCRFYDCNSCHKRAPKTETTLYVDKEKPGGFYKAKNTVFVHVSEDDFCGEWDGLPLDPANEYELKQELREDLENHLRGFVRRFAMFCDKMGCDKKDRKLTLDFKGLGSYYTFKYMDVTVHLDGMS